MASWQDLRQYIYNSYKVSSEDNGILKLLFETSPGRSQLVFVSGSTTGDGTAFAVIASAVGQIGAIDPGALLREASEYVVGGIVAYGNQLAVRHAVPLADLDASDFETPLRLVIGAADSMEAKFLGTDNH